MKKKNSIEIQFEEKRYSSTEVCSILNIKRVTLQKWIGEGFIEPHIKSFGSGTSNYFDTWNLFQIKFFMLLVEHGLSREEAAKRVREFGRNKMLRYGQNNLPSPQELTGMQKLKSEAKWGWFNEDTNEDWLDSLKLKRHVKKPFFFMITRIGQNYDGDIFFEGEEIKIPTNKVFSEIQIINVKDIFE